MIDTIATAGGFIFIAYVMGQIAKGNIERRKQIERLDAEMRLLMDEQDVGASVHQQNNVVDMAAWKNSRA
jgi:hypothetical protein